MKTSYIILALAAAAAIAAAGYYFFWTDQGTAPVPPPDSETAATDTPVDQTGWSTADGNGYHFQYPVDVGLVYVHATDWPPAVKVLDTEFSCIPAGNEIVSTGKTEQISVAGRTFCRTKTSEGAAGSIYHTYDYAFAADTRTAILSFTVRMPQCVNYDEPEASSCAKEQQAFDPDHLAGAMADTFSF